MFADLKSNPDGTYTLMWGDYKSWSAECKVIKSKTSTAAAVANIMVNRGVNKVPWSTLLIYDGDRANKSICEEMAKLGIATMIGIPHRQSLNPAESLIGIISKAAKKALLSAQMPTSFFGHAMEHAAYHHNRISCAARGGMTPYEMVTGEKPDIRHLRKFGQLAFVQKSDAKKHDKDRNLATPLEWCMKAEPVIVIGYRE